MLEFLPPISLREKGVAETESQLNKCKIYGKITATHQLREVILANVEALEVGEAHDGLGQSVELVLPELQDAQP